MQLGPYTVASELGRGGVGVVYAGRSPDGRAVALKLLARPDPDATTRFEREGRLHAELGLAEGFVPLLDLLLANGRPVLVMPLLEGGTLRDRLNRGSPFAVDEAVALVEALARAMARAHERGIVHRDLKPENVLFDGEGRAFVADLGLAKHFDRDAAGALHSVSLSLTGDFRGTTGYAPAEQMAGARDVGPTADVFALGAILYECVTGRAAFAGESLVELIARVEEGSFESARHVRPDLPRWLEDVIVRALARAPEERFADAGALAGALARRETARPRRVVGALVLLALVAAGAAVPFASGLLGNDAAAPVRGVERAPDVERALDPGSAGAWYRRAALHEKSGDLARARAELSRALELDPAHADSLLLRGTLLLRAGEPRAALDDLVKATRRDPALGRAWTQRSLARHALGDLAGARDDALHATKLPGADALAWAALGTMQGESGDPAAAATSFERAVALDPDDVNAWSNLGLARTESNDLDGAVAAYTRVLALDERSVEGWYGRGIALVRLRLRRGYDDLEKFVELAPPSDQRVAGVRAAIERERAAAR